MRETLLEGLYLREKNFWKSLFGENAYNDLEKGGDEITIISNHFHGGTPPPPLIGAPHEGLSNSTKLIRCKKFAAHICQGFSVLRGRSIRLIKATSSLNGRLALIR